MSLLRKRDQKVEVLQRVPLFAGLSKKDLGQLARHLDEVDLKEGTVLTREGELGREAMILLSGTAVVRRKGRKLAELGPGDVIGELSLLAEIPRTASVVATSELTVALMTASDFGAVVDENPQVAVRMLRTVAHRFAELSG
ncbi:MAG: cyclic nucleotide-binding domain-containing protein [Acidimicrobiia bacterium]|jgi:CRP/FNR family transcriptional regulator, cyclic AMP receptor protein